MYRLIYASKISSELHHDDLAVIVSKATKNNKQNGITGLLIFNQEYFLQVLEGDRKLVNELFQRISKNPLHKDIEIIDYGYIMKRMFPRWDMMLATTRTINKDIYYRYSTSSNFNPYSLTAEAALEMIKELAEDVKKHKYQDDLGHAS